MHAYAYFHAYIFKVKITVLQFVCTECIKIIAEFLLSFQNFYLCKSYKNCVKVS